MPERSSKKQARRDINVLAASIVEQATSEPTSKPSSDDHQSTSTRPINNVKEGVVGDLRCLSKDSYKMVSHIPILEEPKKLEIAKSKITS